MKMIMTVLIMLLYALPARAADIPDAGSPAAELFAERCSICHSLPHPGRLDWAHWRSMLHAMKQRMDERGMEIPADEWRQIAGYLQSHAR